MPFVYLSDLSGKSSKAQFGNWAGGCDTAITDAVKSGNGALFKQAVADWAKSGQLARATAATPAEVEIYFARPDVATFATTIWNNVLAGQSPNVAGQQWPQPIFDVKDPNTPSIAKCGETFVAAPAPASAPAFPSAPPPSSSYPPAPGPAAYAASPTYAPAPYAPAPSYAPEPSYAPPPRSSMRQEEYQAEQPAGPNPMIVAAVAGGALLIVVALLLKKSGAPTQQPQQWPQQPQYAQPYPPYPYPPYQQPPMAMNKRRRR